MTKQGIGTHKTALVTSSPGVYRVIYHDTTVFTYNSHTRIVTLDSGGYRTATTKKRINQAAQHYELEFEVYQKAGQWFVKNTAVKFIDWDTHIPFKDGMKIQV